VKTSFAYSGHIGKTTTQLSPPRATPPPQVLPEVKSNRELALARASYDWSGTAWFGDTRLTGHPPPEPRISRASTGEWNYELMKSLHSALTLLARSHSTCDHGTPSSNGRLRKRRLNISKSIEGRTAMEYWGESSAVLTRYDPL
jgi:hypothetical protein